MKYYTVIKDHLIVFLICLVSLSTIVGWLLLASFVRHELIALETSARQANTDLEVCFLFLPAFNSLLNPMCLEAVVGVNGSTPKSQFGQG